VEEGYGARGPRRADICEAARALAAHATGIADDPPDWAMAIGGVQEDLRQVATDLGDTSSFEDAAQSVRIAEKEFGILAGRPVRPHA